MDELKNPEGRKDTEKSARILLGIGLFLIGIPNLPYGGDRKKGSENEG
jgi:hypothetical protein